MFTYGLVTIISKKTARKPLQSRETANSRSAAQYRKEVKNTRRKTGSGGMFTERWQPLKKKTSNFVFLRFVNNGFLLHPVVPRITFSSISGPLCQTHGVSFPKVLHDRHRYFGDSAYRPIPTRSIFISLAGPGLATIGLSKHIGIGGLLNSQ